MYDVVVVGAGPAGSSAAAILESKGYDILLLDKEAFPRNKACAGILPPRIYSEIEVPEDVIERPLEGYRIISPSGESVKSIFPKPGAIVRREAFDSFLLERLETPPERVRILRCASGDDSATLAGDDFSAEARIIIGCDGVNSAVRKALIHGGSSMKSPGQLALGVQYEVQLPQAVIDEEFGGWFEVHYSLPFGYFWVAPLKDTVKVGCGATSPDFKKNSRRILDEFLGGDEIGKRLKGGHLKRFESHLIPMSGPHEILTAKRTLLAGDAGGFVFPGTGEGVHYAMKSGRLAAEAASMVMEEGRFDGGFLNEIYSGMLERNGLLSLRDVDFVNRVLASPENAERYVRKLRVLDGE